jgi:predicted MFS family arabinose efflux permease
MRLGEALSPLRERDFRLLFLGRTASLLGSAFAPVALAFAVLDDLDGTATQLGIVLAAIWLPQIVFILVGGVIGDRLPRHLIMVTTDLVMAGAQAAVAVLLFLDAAELWHLFLLQLVRGIANAFFFPAATGLVPHVVSPSRLQQANALLRLSHSGSTIFGAAAAGLVVAALGSAVALAFDAMTFVVSALFLMRLALPAGQRVLGKDFLGDLREGWSEFSSRRWLWAIVVQFLFINGFANGTFVVLGPLVADEELGGAKAWGVILAGNAAGMVLGGLLVLRLRPQRLLLVASLAVFAMAPLHVLLGLPAALPAIVAGALLMGIGAEVFSVLWDTALQQQIPHERLSRVSSYDALGSFVCIPIGISIAGPVADLIGVQATFFLSAVVVVVATALVLLVGDVRRLRRTDPVAISPEPVLVAQIEPTHSR